MDNTAVAVISAVVSTLVPVLGFLGYMYIELKEWRKEAREDMAKMEKRFEEERRVQTARSDQLYQMFIDLLKNQNPKTKP